MGFIPFEEDWAKAQVFFNQYQNFHRLHRDFFSEDLWQDLWKLVGVIHTKKFRFAKKTFMEKHMLTTLSTDLLVPLMVLAMALTVEQINALPPTWNDAQRAMQLASLRQYELEKSTRSFEWLQTHGRCMDGIRPGNSTIPQAGRGAFSRKRYHPGDIVAHAPLLHVADRSILNMYGVNMVRDERTGDVTRVREPEILQGVQLLLNYCFGRDPSETTLLLCPYGSNTPNINHHSTDYNVKIVWATNTSWFDPKCLDMTPVELGFHPLTCLAIDYIATREIAPGEEILLDYGQEWQKAWQDHVITWKSNPETLAQATSPHYLKARDLNKDMMGPVPTLAEQETNPYMDHLFVKCLHANHKKWFRCRVASRTPKEGGGYQYSVELDMGFPETEDDDWDMTKLLEEDASVDHDDNNEYEQIQEVEYHYKYDEDEYDDEYDEEHDFEHDDVREPPKIYVEKFPRAFIRFADKWHYGDEFLPHAFRHEMRLPDELFSESWKYPSEGCKTCAHKKETSSIDMLATF